MAISIINTPASQSGASGSLGKSKGSTRRSRSMKETAKRILIDSGKLDFSNAGQAESLGRTIYGSQAIENQGSGLWAEQVSFVEGVELTAFFQALSQKIDRSIDYPDDFIKQRLKGEVRLDFYVNKKGQMVGEFQTVKGAEPLLKLYTMASLITGLKETLPKNLWRAEDKNIAISIHVKYDSETSPEVPLSNEIKFNSNEFVLTRTRFVMPLLVEKIEKVFTRYIPPIVPIPGGFYVDLVMLAKYINNINTPDPDEKRKTRLDLTRAQFELAIRKKRNTYLVRELRQ